MGADDKAQQPTGGASDATPKRSRVLMRWLGIAPRGNARKSERGGPDVEQPGLRASLRALPAQLDASTLPNGVVELLVEDFEAPIRQLFDIHDGRIALVEPGSAVPWTSISGSAGAWTRALGEEHNTSELRLTGDERLARRVLAALAASEEQAQPSTG